MAALGALAGGALFHLAFPDESARLSRDLREMGTAAAASVSRAAALAWAQCPAPLREGAEAGIAGAAFLSRELGAEAAQALVLARGVVQGAVDTSLTSVQAWLGGLWLKLPQEQRQTFVRIAGEVLAAVREWAAAAAARARETASTASAAVQAALDHVVDPTSAQKLLGFAQTAAKGNTASA